MTGPSDEDPQSELIDSAASGPADDQNSADGTDSLGSATSSSGETGSAGAEPVSADSNVGGESASGSSAPINSEPQVDDFLDDEELSDGQILVPQMLFFGILLEAGLLLAALLIGWVANFYDPKQPLDGIFSVDWGTQLQLGLMAAIPLLILPPLVDLAPIGMFRNLKHVADNLLTPLFRPVAIWKYALLSLAAGIGEEFLFRWCLQGGLSALFEDPQTGAWVGLVVASALFGLCHWISPSYAFATFAAGIYLGLLMNTSESVVAPIICHATYDFLALIYLGKIRRLPAPVPENELD